MTRHRFTMLLSGLGLVLSGVAHGATVPIKEHPIKSAIDRHRANQIIEGTRGEERLVRLRGLASQRRKDLRRIERIERKLPLRLQKLLARFGEAGARHGFATPRIPTTEEEIRDWQR